MKSGMQHPSYGGRYKSPPSVDVSIVMKALGRVNSGMQHPSYGGRYKSPPSVNDEGTWEGAVWHAAPLLRREVQKSPQCRCFIVMKALGR